MAYEKMSCLYETVKDLRDRLAGTICRYQGFPYYCDVSSKGKVILTDVRALSDPEKWKTKIEISPKDPEFDISSIELGYTNWKFPEKTRKFYRKDQDFDSNRVSFLSRHPARRYRQGISSDVVYAVNIDGGSLGDSSTILGTDGFIAMVQENYPSLPEAVELLSSGEKDVAISREFALKKVESGLILAFAEMKNIGWILPQKMSIEVPEGELSWVYKRLMERLIDEN